MSSLSPVTNQGTSEIITPARPLRVLLVEDSADDALLLRRHLTRSGFLPEMQRVETAEKMLLALEERWDCVLADYNLPLFSAPEALKLLQSTGRDLPFIMMSGAVSEATAVAAMRAGAHDYVSKENLARLGPAIERELAEAASRRIKRATEKALRSSEERFHRLVEATPLALLISDLHGRVSYSNPGVERLLGFSQADLDVEGFSLGRMFTAEDFGVLAEGTDPGLHVMTGLHARVTSHPGETWESTCCHRDSTSIPVLLGAAVLNPEARAEELRLAVFIVDVSEQKRSEEVLRRTEKLAAAGRLAASIAHEINNPLEAVTNCLYLLEQSPLDDPSRLYLKMAQRELDRVTHITTQTLRFYRQSSRVTQTSIPELIDSVLALNEGRLRTHSIEVIRDYKAMPEIAALDGEIRQVLANLIGNAVDAMISTNESHGPHTLTLRGRAAHDSRNHEAGISLAIADNGCGMSRETLRRIYEPFFSTKGLIGTGLGLWVSHEILTKHSAHIAVKSRQGEHSGTVFRIFLPIAPAIVEGKFEPGMPSLA
jgi:signal transduction histidine kinase/FixJ family two-component response regulator